MWNYLLLVSTVASFVQRRNWFVYETDRARFSVQPLTILGVTGPFSVLAENMYTLCESSFGINFLQFMAWSLIHSAWMHYVLAIFNAHDFTMQYVTTFSTEIFSLLNSIIYFHKAIQELQRAHDALSFAAFLYAIIGAIGTMLFAIFLSTAESWKPLFGKYVRLGLTEYAAAISIIVFIALPHVGELAELDKSTLVVSNSFRPTSPDRPPYFYVAFWELPSKWIAAAVIPGLIITVLFFFDHEVSSIICTIDRYGTRKPGGYAWDIVLLGTTTAMCGILGIPPANGLLPQAPLHSESLMHEEKETVPIDETEVPSRSNENDIALSDLSPNSQPTTKTVTVRRVYEQRWSALLHSCLIMAFTSPPLMKVLGLTPTSVLAGLFMFMGEQSLSVNPILYRVFYILTPISELPKLKLKGWKSDPKTSSGNNTPTNSQAPALSSLESTPESWFYTNPYIPLHIFTALQLVITIGIFIMTLSNTAAPAFPLVIVLLVPLRLMVMGRVYERMWGSIRGKSVLAFVDAWACRDGAPGADELENMEEGAEAGENIGVLSETEGDAVKGMPGAPGEEANRPSSSGNRRIDSTEAEQDISTAEAESWVELGIMETPRNQSRRAS